MDNIDRNPKDSNVYRKAEHHFCTTPAGSHGIRIPLFYKYQIPSGLKNGGINK